jgi:hypothetical protein
MPMPYCDCCGGPATRVVASRSGPMSESYCDQCLAKGYMSAMGAKALLFCVPIDRIDESYKQELVLFNGKEYTLEEFAKIPEVIKENEEAWANYDEWCENQGGL